MLAPWSWRKKDSPRHKAIFLISSKKNSLIELFLQNVLIEFTWPAEIYLVIPKGVPIRQKATRLGV